MHTKNLQSLYMQSSGTTQVLKSFKIIAMKKEKLINLADWFLYLCLCVISLEFMGGVLQQYLSEATNFKQGEESIMHPPTVTTCISK